MDLSTTSVTVTSDQVSSQLDGEEVILNLEDGTYYGLNEVGARIWALIQDEAMLDRVRDRLLAEFDVDPEQCERDLITLMEELQQAGLVEIQHTSHETS